MTITATPHQHATDGTEADEGRPAGTPAVRRPAWALPLCLAAVASAGAGIIHVAAAGAHGEHLPAATVFALLAAAQLGFVAVVALRRTVFVAALGAALGGGAVLGWAQSVTVGIGAISGLDQAGDPQWADTAAAMLAAAAALVSAAAVVGARGPRRSMTAAGRAAIVTAAALVALAVLPTVVAAGRHDHDHDGPAERPGEHTDDHAAEPSAVPPAPFDPTKPIDLGGVDGVTPEQQARAENLIAVTLLRLPRFADHRVAEAAGYRSIGDGVTGHEHFVLWSAINDDKILDPDVPESLVYRIDGPSKTLVAAMYMLRDGDTLDAVPDVGGPLTQWHIHDNLCYTPDPVQPLVRGLTDADGTCRPPLVKGREIPMIHVWIVPHECGPFAALEGVGAGQIRPGETRWCDHAHGV